MALVACMVGDSPKVGVARCGNAGDQSLDVVCDLLANQRRRYVLASLADNTQSIAPTELAENIAVHENEKARAEIPKETVRTISTSLYHIHIPKLVDAGAVEYDQDRDLVQISETTDLIERVLPLDADGGEGRV